MNAYLFLSRLCPLLVIGQVWWLFATWQLARLFIQSGPSASCSTLQSERNERASQSVTMDACSVQPSSARAAAAAGLRAHVACSWRRSSLAL